MDSTIIFPVVAIVLFSIWALYRIYTFAMIGTSFRVLMAAFLGFVASIGCVVLIPFDIESSSTSTHLSFLYYGWSSVYCLLQLLSWVIYPFSMEKELSGSWMKSIKRNMYWWLVYLVLGGVALVYSLFMTPYGVAGLLAVVYAASNTWGLFLIIVLGGYGMAAAPKWLWMQARPSQYMEYLYVKAVGVNDAYLEAKNALFRVYWKAQTGLEATDPDLISATTYISSEFGDVNRMGNSDAGEVYDDLSVCLRDAMQRARRAHCGWKLLSRGSMLYEDVYGSQSPDAMTYMHRGRHVSMAILAVLVGLLSVLVIVGQSTIFLNTWWLSPLAVLFRKYFWVINTVPFVVSLLLQFLLMLPILWLFYCCYWSLTRLKFSQFYGLYPLHNTDAVSLLWCASLLVRISFPLVYNYLLLLHVPSGTVFQYMFGYMDIVPVLGTVFVKFFPFLVLIVALLTVTNSYSKFIAWLGLDALQFEINAGSIDPQERSKLINEGKALVRKQRVADTAAILPSMELQQRNGRKIYSRLQDTV